VIRLSVLASEAEVSGIIPAWWQLLSEATASEPTCSPLWLQAWWKVFGGDDGRSLRVVAIHDDAQLIGLVPLSHRRVRYARVLPFARLELLGSGEPEADEICSDYIGAIVAAGRDDEVAAALAVGLLDGSVGAWDELLMPNMNGESLMATALPAALRRAGLDVETSIRTSCPYISLPSSWDLYLEQLSSDKRYMVRRSLRDFDKWAAGASSLQIVTQAEDIVRGREILTSLHGERWQDAGRTGVFGSRRFASFHEMAMRDLFERDALELAWLEVREEPVAAAYNIVWNGKVSFYQAGRKTDVPKGVRPGIVLHAQLIQRAIAMGRREYDFLAGTSQYKTQLATNARPLLTLRAVGRSWRETARRGLATSLDRLRKARDAGRHIGARLRKRTPAASP
jgi:CelD/BcsL family acetyltransferase involved in cellulose biosynthesis